MKIKQVVVPAAVALVLSACGTSHLSRDITPEGWVNGDVVFPDKTSATLKEGIFPNPAGLKAISTGVTKEQVYTLIGRPHFREGVFNVREWDYILNFWGTRGQYATCQYKIVFSEDGHATSFFPWPGLCGPALEDFEVTPEEADAIRSGKVSVPGGDPAENGEQGTRTELSADTLFAFDSDAVTAVGLASLLQLANSIKSEGLDKTIVIEGHADRIGGASYNEALSKRRAEAVREVLEAAGVEGSMTTRGFGSTAPRVQCAEQSRASLVACLSPNRRVVVIARK